MKKIFIAAALAASAFASQAADIVDTAAAAGDFKTLVAAVKAAGLVDTLKGKVSVHGLRSYRRSVCQDSEG